MDERGSVESGKSDEYGAPGPFPVAIVDGCWHDPARQRMLPWRHYRPQCGEGAASLPLVIHSHGLGGSRESGSGWLAHWASWGIAALAVQHPGSDRAAQDSASPLALRRLLRTATDAGQLAARQHDLRFALDQVSEMSPLAIGISGHSFGAVSALRVIGERRGYDDLPADPRVAATVLFSPSARGGSTALAERFAGVTLPCLHLTGSRDDGIGRNDIRAADRRLPFAHMPGPSQSLLVLDVVTHAGLAGDLGGRDDGDGRGVLLRAASTAFLLAYLARQDAALRWLFRQLPKQLSAADLLHVRGAPKLG